MHPKKKKGRKQARREMPGMAEWVEDRLAREKRVEDAYAFPESRPVSVRLEPVVLALLDAFAERFRLTRSKMLLTLIESGLAQAYSALPVEDRRAVQDLAAAQAARAGHEVDFSAELGVPGEEEWAETESDDEGAS